MQIVTAPGASLPLLETVAHNALMPGVTKSEVEAFFHSNRSKKKRDIRGIETILAAFEARAREARMDELAARWIYDNQWG